MSYDEEDSEPTDWRYRLRSLFLGAVIVGLASGWVLTVVGHRKELRKLRSQVEHERQLGIRVIESVYMTTTDEEIKKRLLATWEEALSVNRDNPNSALEKE